MCETVSGSGISNANTVGLSGPFSVATIAARHACCPALRFSYAPDRSVDPLPSTETVIDRPADADSELKHTPYVFW